jgi:AMMECR1 domain-containing protein
MEIIMNAVSAATEDPRFYPVLEEELPELSISVDILGTPEAVSKREELDPVRYGIIVCSGPRKGLLLPMLEGVDTVEQQIAITRQKAGIGSDEPIEIYRFTVIRYH